MGKVFLWGIGEFVCCKLGINLVVGEFDVDNIECMLIILGNKIWLNVKFLWILELRFLIVFGIGVVVIVWFSFLDGRLDLFVLL